MRVLFPVVWKYKILKIWWESSFCHTGSHDYWLKYSINAGLTFRSYQDLNLRQNEVILPLIKVLLGLKRQARILLKKKDLLQKNYFGSPCLKKARCSNCEKVSPCLFFNSYLDSREYDTVARAILRDNPQLAEGLKHMDAVVSINTGNPFTYAQFQHIIPPDVAMQ